MKSAPALILSILIISAVSFAQEIENVDADAVEAWIREGKQFRVLDVRSVAEFVWVGHPQDAFNVPLMYWDSETGMRPNPDFLGDVAQRFTPDETIIVICLSGVRSAKATGMLKEAGFSSVFNFIDGFEGPKGEDGLRKVSGWRAGGLPYSYDTTEEQKYSPSEKEEHKDPAPSR